MSPKSLRFTARQIRKIIEVKGFSLSRQSGSHMIFYNEKGALLKKEFYDKGKLIKVEEAGK